MRQTNLKSGDNAASSLAFPSHVPDLDQVLGANLSPALTLKKKNPLPSLPFSVADPVATSPYSLFSPPPSPPNASQTRICSRPSAFIAQATTGGGVEDMK